MGGTGHRGSAVAAACLAVLLAAGHAAAQPFLRARLLRSDLGQTVGAYAPSGDTTRLFVVDQSGIVRILNLTDNSVTTFLNIGPSAPAAADRLTIAGGERGLLGLAFDPDFATNGRFYVNYTTTGSVFSTRIDRFTVSGNPATSTTVNMASRLTLLSFQQDYDNHNGGALAFGPDGMLYVGSGDGGSANDPLERAQSLDSLLGKVLRLDVNDLSTTDGDGLAVPNNNPLRAAGGAVRPYIWARGLRNPWRLSFDRETGDLWIADVGQDAREEINFQPRFVPGGGGNAAQVANRNYGWDCREGEIAVTFSDRGCDPNATGVYTDPIKTYVHDFAGSITGGYVYRGTAIPELVGAYVHADYIGNWIKSLRYDGSVTDERDWTSQLAQAGTPIGQITAIAEDGVGELYVVTIGGRVYRIEPDDQNCGCPCALSGNQGVVFEDDFQFDKGWTATANGPVGAGQGVWQRHIPIDDPAWPYAPAADADGSGRAYLTGNALGESDVDGGSVTLTSPVMNFTQGQITVCYSYFLYVDQRGGDNPDELAVEISSDGGSQWTRVRQHRRSTGGQSWRADAITQSELSALGIANTANMRIRFVAEDNQSPDQSVVEAAVDAFKVYTGNPFPDCNANGVDDAQDIAAATSRDCNGNGRPDECDIRDAIAAAVAAGNQGLRIDLDGGPVGRRTPGAALFSACVGCHGETGTGGTGPNIRNKERVVIRDRLTLRLPHPGGGFPNLTAQDFADLEAFLADGGSRGRPDGVIDACQRAALSDCDGDSITDGRELHLGTQVDAQYDGVPDACPCRCDFDGQNGLQVADIFTFLRAWFASQPSADFDGANGIEVADIFAFLRCWFGGC